jgi:geranylgeranyl diphosphate synthase type II
MQSFELLSQKFALHFEKSHFPQEPASLYEPGRYFLKLGGKRIRPVLCLMGNELFDEIKDDAWHAATAIELFHNFTLIHDDIMDNAPLRRGMPSLHHKYGSNTAILAGDMMLVTAYEYLNKIGSKYLSQIMRIFNTAAKMVCEGQQLDLDFAQRTGADGTNGYVSIGEYLKMIELKTSVLLAASLRMGAFLGGAGERNQNLLYEFGKKLGIAFQVQDDYLDAFGDADKFGKQIGGDILANKKTFLLIHAYETAAPDLKKELETLMAGNSSSKVEKVVQIFRDCGVDTWALELKNRYLSEALAHLEDIAVISKRKEPLRELAHFLVRREH